MFIYHSYPGAVRVTVAGRYNVNKGQLELAVARCSKNDDFLKRTKVYPERPEFTVQTKLGPKTIPARPQKIVEGGVDIATRRLEDNKLFMIVPMGHSCSQKEFNEIAAGVATLAINNPQQVEESKHGK